MPLLKGRKTAKRIAITEDAERALAEGRNIFVARYWDEILNFQGTGSVAGASEAIEAVEDVGWRLEHTAYTWVDSKKRGVQVLTFRRSTAD